jgi:hypothetical protein
MNSILHRVKILSEDPGWLKYTPLQKGEWDNYFFDESKSLEEYDFCIVLGDVAANESFICNSDRVILVIFEPPEIKSYSSGFLGQFSAVLTWRDDITHENLMAIPPSLPWMVGGRYGKHNKEAGRCIEKDYVELKKIVPIRKEGTISTICSDKKLTGIQEKRIKLTNYLEGALSEFGIKTYGYGRNPISDKWDAIYPFKYHIAIENAVHSNYWTEKVADAFLGFSYPFYYGCPNLEDFFSPNAFTYIDIDDYEKTLWIINNSILNDYHEKNFEYLLEARNLVLDKYNIFPNLVNQLNKMGNGVSAKGKVLLRPERSYSKGVLHRVVDRCLPDGTIRRKTVKSVRDGFLKRSGWLKEW